MALRLPRELNFAIAEARAQRQSSDIGGRFEGEQRDDATAGRDGRLEEVAPLRRGVDAPGRLRVDGVLATAFVEQPEVHWLRHDRLGAAILQLDLDHRERSRRTAVRR